MTGVHGWDRTRLESLLGEPLMVDDPLITMRQAATVLEVSTDRVRQLVSSGQLVAHGGSGWRRLQLSEVLRLAGQSRVSVAEAATMLSVKPSQVHRFVRAGLLADHGGALPVTRQAVERLGERRRQWLTVAESADRLALSPATIHQLLLDEILTHTNDAGRPVYRDQVDALQRLGQLRRSTLGDVISAVHSAERARVLDSRLYVGVGHRGPAAIVMPVGVLDIATAPRLRNTLLKSLAEQPTAVVVDLALLRFEASHLLGIFSVAAQHTHRWSGTELALVPGPSRTGAPDPIVGPISRFVQVQPSVEAALERLRAGSPPPRRIVVRRLRSDPAAVPAARRLVRETCLDWGCGNASDDAELIAAELVTNAVLHARTSSTIRLELRRGLLTIAVTDQSPRPAEPRPQHESDSMTPTGFGLRIVDQLAKAWRSVPTADGKTVWATLRVSG
jgi:anti-sigma regulatory factor (Ser/Thr protein kinase)